MARDTIGGYVQGLVDEVARQLNAGEIRSVANERCVVALVGNTNMNVGLWLADFLKGPDDVWRNTGVREMEKP